MIRVLAIAAFIGWSQLLPNDLTVAAIAALCVARFFNNVDKRPAILEIAALIAVLQFLVAAVFMYRMGNDHPKYYMYVEEGTYFSFTIPATCCLLFGLFVPLSHAVEKFRKPRPLPRLNNLGIVLVAIGFICAVSMRYSPVQLRFVFYLLAQLRYVGVLYLYFNKSPIRWVATGLIFLSLLADSAQSGMFHELLLWGALLPTFYFLARPPSMKVKVLFMATAFCTVAAIQLVKHEYRELVWKGQNASLTSVLFSTIQREDAFGREWQEGLVMRMNQGWLVSAAMNHVPYAHDFAHGETIKEALVAALVPRALVSDKRTASSSENTREYTGLHIGYSTSMGLSPLGEAYVNFGELGGCGVMLCFGLVLNGIYHLLVRMGRTDQYFLFVLPLVFLQAIKMETEFLTVFNHLTKSGILITVLYVTYIREPHSQKHPRRAPARSSVRSRRSSRMARRTGAAVR